MCAIDRLGTTVHCKFAVDAVDVPLYSADSNDQLLRNRLIREAIHEQPQYLEFAFSKGFDEWAAM